MKAPKGSKLKLRCVAAKAREELAELNEVLQEVNLALSKQTLRNFRVPNLEKNIEKLRKLL